MQSEQKVLKLRNNNGCDGFPANSQTITLDLIQTMWMLRNLVQKVPGDQIGQGQHWSGVPRNKIHLLPNISSTLWGAGAWPHWNLQQEWVWVLSSPPPWAPPSFWSCAWPVDFSNVERWSSRTEPGPGNRGGGAEGQCFGKRRWCGRQCGEKHCHGGWRSCTPVHFHFFSPKGVVSCTKSFLWEFQAPPSSGQCPLCPLVSRNPQESRHRNQKKLSTSASTQIFVHIPSLGVTLVNPSGSTPGWSVCWSFLSKRPMTHPQWPHETGAPCLVLANPDSFDRILIGRLLGRRSNPWESAWVRFWRDSCPSSELNALHFWGFLSYQRSFWLFLCGHRPTPLPQLQPWQEFWWSSFSLGVCCPWQIAGLLLWISWTTHAHEFVTLCSLQKLFAFASNSRSVSLPLPPKISALSVALVFSQSEQLVLVEAWRKQAGTTKETSWKIAMPNLCSHAEKDQHTDTVTPTSDGLTHVRNVTKHNMKCVRLAQIPCEQVASKKSPKCSERPKITGHKPLSLGLPSYHLCPSSVP